MSISKFNKVSPFTFKAEGEYKYYSLKDLYQSNGADAVYRVMALYINSKGRYEQSVALTPHFYINLPSHLTDDVCSMIQDPDVVAQINRGEAGLKIRPYTNRYGSTSYSVEWLDINSDLPY